MRQPGTGEGLQRRLVCRWRLMDLVCRLRAAHVLYQTRILRHLPRTGTMLDVGAGYGHVAEAIVRDAPDRSCVLLEPGYDLSPRVVQRLASYACQSVRGDGRCLPFADATFDAAWALFILHHIEVADQAAVLREVGRVLRSGGVFVLAEDTPGSPDEHANAVRADRRLNFESDAAPHNYRASDAWRDEIEVHGFTLVEEVAFAWLYPPVTFVPVPHRAYICRRR
jgi:SAM-dependent methyltransferase